MLKFSQLEAIGEGKILQLYHDRIVTAPVIDSRKLLVTEGTVFFAIAGDRHDGHQFIGDLYEMGVRQFVVEKPIGLSSFPEGNFLLLRSSRDCLQSLVIHHRNHLHVPVIGITGSNGENDYKGMALSAAFTGLQYCEKSRQLQLSIGCTPVGVGHGGVSQFGDF